MELRPYQRDGESAIESALKNGYNRILLQYPTGTGKTVMFADFPIYFRDWVKQQGPARGAHMLVIAHREELLDQAADKIRRQNPPGFNVSIEQADRYASRFSEVVIASIQTLAASKFARLKALLRHHDFRIVIVDEAHHAAAASYRNALVHLGFLPPADASDTENIEAAEHDDITEMQKALQGWDKVAPKDRMLVGVTATPNRSDSIGLGCVFQTIGYSYPLKKAIADGWLAPIVPYVVETKTSVENVRTTAGEFNQKDLAETVNNPTRNKLALDVWKHYAGDRPTLAFTVDIQHAVDAANLFAADGIPAVHLSGKTPKEERRAILEDYTRGRLQVIFNCQVLTEGTDLPRTSCILHMKPTKSATLYEQMTGRGLRLFEGKDHCVVIDLVDLTTRHTLQAAPVLYGLPPGLKTAGEDLAELEEELAKLNIDVEAQLKHGRLTLEQLKNLVSTFDIFAVPVLDPDFLKNRLIDWIKMGEEDYRVQYPWTDGANEEATETLQLSRDLVGTWEVVATLRTHRSSERRQRTIAAGAPTLNECARLAEAYMQRERSSVVRIRERNAGWKRGPASDKQIELLRKIAYRNHVDLPKDPRRMTKGEASMYIDLANARRNFRTHGKVAPQPGARL
jgi:superfamily II DNA or RNA helicase